MKKFSRVMTLGLATLMAMSVAGCASNQQTNTNATNNTKPVETEKTETKVEEQKEEEQVEEAVLGLWDKYEPMDLGGREFVFAYNWDMIPMTTDVELDPSTAIQEHYDRLANMKRIEEKYNCKITYINVPYAQIIPTLTTSVMAGEPFADGVRLANKQVFPAIIGGLVNELTDLAPANSDMMNEKLLVSAEEVLGGNYVIQSVGLPQDGKYLAFNKDMIEGLGLETPDELFAKGEWNWENFMKIAKAATKDTNGDGVIDQWGIGGIPQNLADLFVASNDGMLLDVENKKQGFDDPKTMEALEFLNQIYNVEQVAYLYNDDPWEWTGNQDCYKEGNVAMFYIETWMLMSSQENPLPFEYGCAPAPTGPSNNKGYSHFMDKNGMVIPTGVKDPHIVAQIIEELEFFVGDNVSERAEADRVWVESLWLTEEDVEMTIEISANQKKYDYYQCVPSYPIGSLMTNIITGGKTVAQAVEEIKQVAQDKVDELFAN